MIQYLINILYRYPKSLSEKWKKYGGIVEYQRMIINRRSMKKAAYNLPPVTSYRDGLTIYFLTGGKYLYQTLYCIQSLTKVCKEKFCFKLIDDGSFDKELIKIIRRQLPHSIIITADIIEANLKQSISEEEYPVLINKRKEYPHIKKITDIHTLPEKGWKLVLDSDMLFCSYPESIIKWLKKPEMPIYMLDCVESYGYSNKLMHEIINKDYPSLLNVGVIGLKSESIIWRDLNTWIAILENKEGKTYYLEQALSAMMIGNQVAFILSDTDYIVNPDKNDILNKTGVLQHFVDVSKKGYFDFAWKKLI